jgi:hypothetical protein
VSSCELGRFLNKGTNEKTSRLMVSATHRQIK